MNIGIVLLIVVMASTFGVLIASFINRKSVGIRNKSRIIGITFILSGLSWIVMGFTSEDKSLYLAIGSSQISLALLHTSKTNEKNKQTRI